MVDFKVTSKLRKSTLFITIFALHAGPDMHRHEYQLRNKSNAAVIFQQGYRFSLVLPAQDNLPA